ncbi:Cation efflux system related [Chlorella sorokiniana]|uniref:Glutathione peroxidase n=1 Tax=Chlorella sorokiniana TaxID=3076 RepID=A0A2P6TJF9_CHLSO|nr:Cation efflux system related [Chlorella sorokiniana]|eukprot:PRW39381.1 Cation efflux system related [Chlorella sorokiniana]
MAPAPHAALSAILQGGSAGGSYDDGAPSEPPSPLLRDGCTLLDPTPSGSRGPASAAPSPPNGLLGSGAGLCRLACGATAEESADSKRMQRKLIAALCLAFLFMLVEVAGGIYAHSLAIITDAAHLLSDVSGFAVAVLAAIWAKRRASAPFSFGYHRVEVLGALASVMMVWVITLNLLAEAIHRLIEPEPVNGKVMFIVAVIGVAVNVLMMLVLGHHHHGHACSGHSHSHGPAHAHAHHGSCGGGSGADSEDEAEGDYVLSAFLPILGAAGAQRSDAGDPDQHAKQAQQAQQQARAKQQRQAKQQEQHQLVGGGEGAEGDAALAALKGQACGHGHDNMNMRGAIIHVIGDFVQSIGVAVAGALIWWHQDDPRWHIADPICTFLFAILVLWTTKAITKDIFAVLMQRAPAGVDVEAVRRALGQVQGVQAVEDLHIWSLTPGIPLLSAHVAIAKGADAAAVVRDVERLCRQSLGIEHTTIQPVPAGSTRLESVQAAGELRGHRDAMLRTRAPLLLLLLGSLAAVRHASAAVGTLLADRVIFSGKLASGMGDSSYKGGRLADLTGAAAGGGVAATFNPKPGAGLQFYFSTGAIDASKHAGLAFKIAADTQFAVNGGITVGVQVAPGTPKGVPLKNYLADGKVGPAWQAVFVPLADLGAGTSLSRTLSVYWQGGTAQQAAMYIQGVTLAALPLPAVRKPPPSSPSPSPSPKPSPSPSPKPSPPPGPPLPTHPYSLYTDGAAIKWKNGTRFSGRGCNIQDTRSCVACVGQQNASEVIRRMDFAITSMGARMFRLDMETYGAGDEALQWCYPNCNVDAAYLNDLDTIVTWVANKHPGVQVLLAAWNSKRGWGATDLEWPTATTIALWRTVVTKLGKHPHVWWGVTNEPEYNFDGAQDAQVWQAMNAAVAAIRATEKDLGQYPHIITVQGTRAWARPLEYYVTHPITAGSGVNVAYETHPYNPAADFASLWVKPAQKLPVYIGEFGPVDGSMTSADAETLMQTANSLGIPWTAWTLHMRCPPNLLQDLNSRERLQPAAVCRAVTRKPLRSRRVTGTMGISFSTPSSDATNFHQLSALDIDKQAVDFASLDGKVVLDFKALKEKYADKGLVIMAFPCNQFGFQEPGTNAEIKKFAADRGFTGEGTLLMDKVKVNGAAASPVFQFLKVASGDTGPIMWNFAKFLVRKNGTVYGRFGVRTLPSELIPQIEECLALEQ